MKSLGAMIKQLAALVGTADLNGWETGFVENVAEHTRNGADTRSLTEPQIDKLQSLYAKHFGDAT